MNRLPQVGDLPLEEAEAEEAFGAILDGTIADEEVAGFLIALSERGETASEIAGAARAMRARLIPIRALAGAARPDGATPDGGDNAFNKPWGVAPGPNGVAYLSESGSRRIWQLAPDGTPTLLAGLGEQSEPIDGFYIGAGFKQPLRMATAPDGSILVVDHPAGRLRRVRLVGGVGAVTTIDVPLDGLKDVEQVFVNGNLEHRVPHNLNMSFNFVEGESLIMGIKGLAVSSGSACTSASLEPSYVLRALGRSDELAHSSLRMTIGRFTTEEEIDYAVSTIKQNVAKLRELSPLWEMYQDGIDLNTIQWTAH